MNANGKLLEEDGTLPEVRSIDEVGRVVIPRSLRLKYDVNIGDEIAFFDTGELIGIKKYRSSCCVCGSLEKLSPIGEKVICQCCIASIAVCV